MKDYDLGKNRVWYTASGFVEELSVTGLFFKPDGSSVSDIVFEEHQSGVYSTVFSFDTYGKWLFLIYEDGTPTITAVKRIGF